MAVARNGTFIDALNRIRLNIRGMVYKAPNESSLLLLELAGGCVEKAGEAARIVPNDPPKVTKCEHCGGCGFIAPDKAEAA